MTDPSKPHYHVPYDPDSRGKGGGSGDGFATDLQHLYVTGKTKLPEIAQDFSGASAVLAGVEAAMQAVTGAMGDPGCMRDLLRIRGRLQRAAYDTTLAASESGVAVLRMVDLYASADQATAEAFNGLSKDAQFRDAYEDRTPSVTPPADPNAPEPEPAPLPHMGGMGGLRIEP